MIPVAQTILAPPDGNCYAACIAAILECPLAEVPNIASLQSTQDGRDKAWRIIQGWLRDRGLMFEYVEGDPLRTVPPSCSGYWIATHKKDAVPHATVWYDTALAWNPYPGHHEDADLGDLLMAEWFVAIDPARVARSLA